MFGNKGPLGGPRLTDKAPFAQSDEFNTSFGLQTNKKTFSEGTEYCVLVHGRGRASDYYDMIDGVLYDMNDFMDTESNGDLEGTQNINGESKEAAAMTFGVGILYDEDVTLQQFIDLVEKRLTREGIPYTSISMYELVA